MIAAAILVRGLAALAADPPIGSPAIIDAFAASHAGYSSDELLVRDDLRESFLMTLAAATKITVDPRERSGGYF